jgi:integrase
MPDNRHLQKRRQGWYVRVAVPESLWKAVGKRHIIKSLKTRDVAEARQLRWAALSEIKAQLAEAHRQQNGGSVPRAIDLAAWEIEQRQWYQDVLRRCPENGTRPDDDNELDSADLVLWDIAEEVEETHGLRRAKQFVEFVRNSSAPIEATKTAWLKQITDTVAEQTRAQHEVAIAALVKHDPMLMFVADVTRKKAGTFIEWMDQASGKKRATVNRYISSLSSFWKWMIKRGITESNPWSGQMLAKKARGSSKGAKRPYTNDELVKLLSVSAKDIRRGNYAQAIHDLMRLGLLTGARLNELCSLVAADIDSIRHSLSITDGKTHSATRVIPLHDLAWPIVARRLQAAQGDGPLKRPSWVPRSGSDEEWTRGDPREPQTSAG